MFRLEDVQGYKGIREEDGETSTAGASRDEHQRVLNMIITFTRRSFATWCVLGYKMKCEGW